MDLSTGLPTVPPGRGHELSLPTHFVPGYDQTVPPGQSHSPIEELRIKLALMGLEPWAESCSPSGQRTSQTALS